MDRIVLYRLAQTTLTIIVFILVLIQASSKDILFGQETLVACVAVWNWVTLPPVFILRRICLLQIELKEFTVVQDGYHRSSRRGGIPRDGK